MIARPGDFYRRMPNSNVAEGVRGGGGERIKERKRGTEAKGVRKRRHAARRRRRRLRAFSCSQPPLGVVSRGLLHMHATVEPTVCW